MTDKSVLERIENYPELDDALLQQIFELKKQFGKFWRRNLRVSKGFSTAAFSRADVEPFLESAAELVVLLRSILYKNRPAEEVNRLVHISGGKAQDFLWYKQHEADYHPFHDTNQFERDLIHAAFKSDSDEQEYEPPLTKESLDAYIDKAKEWQSRLAEERVKIAADLEKAMAEKLAKLPKLFEEIAASKSINHGSRAYLEALHSINTRSDGIIHRMTEIRKTAEASAALELKIKKRQEEYAEKMDIDRKQKELEQKQNEERQRNIANFKIKIDSISADVETNVKPKLRDLEDNIEKLDIEEIFRDPIKGEKTVSNLHKQCMFYGHQLMNDLLSLDGIVGDGVESVRNERKQQVTNIQQIMSGVENLQQRLETLRKQVSEAKEEELARRKQEQSEEEDEEQQQESEEPAEEAIDSDGGNTDGDNTEGDNTEEVKNEADDSEMMSDEQAGDKALALRKSWADMKLEVDFEISQRPGAYVISGYIPGLDQNDISIGVDKQNILTVKGVRKPSPHELATMKKHLESDLGIEEYANKDDALLLWGAGRFGGFAESYRLPRDALSDNISARYQRGVLEVIIPRARRQVPARRRNPYASDPFGSFLGNNNYWW